MITRLLHFAVYGFQAIRRCIWFVTRPRTLGVHGIALTPEGKIILVTLSYAKGWRLPGGGRKRNEDPGEAMLRELREEIGMLSFTGMEAIADFSHRPDFRQGEATLFIIRGVDYAPRWSLEVARVAEFDVQQLPVDTAEITRQLLKTAQLA